jgi:PHD/YefM family antitoxin component YafN of YafNO toxin-antitoxin module
VTFSFKESVGTFHPLESIEPERRGISDRTKLSTLLWLRLNPPVPSQDVRLTVKRDALILHKIMSSSTYTISQAQAKLPRLIKEDSFAISVHGEVKGFYLSKQRLEAMIESIELLENPEFTAALKAHRSGRAKTYTVKELDEKFSA